MGSIGTAPISVNDISGGEYLGLRDAGWRISGAWMLPPRSAQQLAVPKKARVALGREIRPPDTSKTRKKKKARGHVKFSPPRNTPPKSAKPRQKQVALSPESIARLRSTEPFQLAPLAPTERVTPSRASFTEPFATAKINWNDESEDGSMWQR